MIKLIYQEDDKTCIVRMKDGSMKKVSLEKDKKLSEEYGMPIGESETVEPQDVKLIWRVKPKKLSKKELIEIRNKKALEYYYAHKDKFKVYQQQRRERLRKELDKKG